MAVPKPTIHTPARGLTVRFVEELQPREDRYEVADRRAPGLRLRVMPTGRKTFRWYRTERGGKRDVVTIGPFHPDEVPPPGFVSLKGAREWLERLKTAHAGGTLPAVEAELRRLLRRPVAANEPAQAASVRGLFKTVAEEFYTDDILKNRKHPEDVRAVLDRDIYPLLGTRELDEIVTLDCRDVVKRCVARGAPVHAGRVLSILKQFFGWAQANGFTDRNPAAPLKARHLGVEVNVSTRWLTDAEVALFWKALDRAVRASRHESQKLRPATAAALRILLLTAVRTGELLKARWEHVDFDAKTWTIPPANQKTTKAQERRAKPFVIPLPPTAMALFKELKAIADATPITTESGEKMPSPWVMASEESDGGHYTDKALGRAMRRLFENKAPILSLPGGPASPHDLRRTARTHLGKLRVPPHIVERCLNHSLGRIVQTYDQNDYLDERREALGTWDVHVRHLAGSP